MLGRCNNCKTAQTYDLVAKTGAKNTHKIKTLASCMQGWR